MKSDNKDVAPAPVAIPAEALLARLGAASEAWIAGRISSFEATMRRAGQSDGFIAERLAAARASCASEVTAAREHIAAHAGDPRAFAARILNSEARAMLIARCAATTALDTPRRFGGDESIDGDAVFWSDLEVAGDLRIGGHVVVAGSVIAGGEVVVGETGALVVARAIRAPIVGGSGWVIGAGDVAARLVWGHYEAGSFDVAGEVRADLAVFADHGHNFDRSAVGRYVDLSGDDGSAASALEAAVAPAALGERGTFGRVDLRRLRELAAVGAPILKALRT